MAHRRLIRTAVAATSAALGLLLAAPTATAQADGPSRAERGAIVFVSDRDSTPTVVKDQLYLLRPGSGRVDRLTDNLDADWWPALSPDGRSVAWLKIPVDADGAVPDQATVHVCRLVQQHGRWVCRGERTLAPVRTLQTSLAWTPDSRRVLYAGLTDTGTTDIFSVRVSGAGTPRNLTNDAFVDNQPAVSPNGRYFVYGREGDLVRRRIDGSDPLLMTGGAGPADGVDNGPDYSPDGSRIAFHSNRGDGDSDIYVMCAAPEGPGNRPVNLTDGLAGQQRRPTWSPDGGSLAFWGHPTAASFDRADIYRMRADGTQVRNLTDDQDPAIGDIQPDWGPLAAHR